MAMSQRQIGVLVCFVAFLTGLSAPAQADPSPTPVDLLSPADGPVIPRGGGGLVDVPLQSMDRESIKLLYTQRVASVRSAVKKVVLSKRPEDFGAKSIGVSDGELTAFTAEGATILYTKFGNSHGEKHGAEIPGDGYFWMAPTSEGGLGGIGMEFSTQAGTRGVYMEITKFSFRTRDGVRAGPNTVLAFNTFMYQRIGNAFFSSLLSADGNGEAVKGMDDASNYQTLIDNFHTFDNGPDELRDFVDQAIPEFLDRIKEAPTNLGKKSGRDSFLLPVPKSHLACVASAAGAIAFCLAGDLPACLIGGATVFDFCGSPFGNSQPTTVIVVTCTTTHEENGDTITTCTARISPNPMIRP